MREKRLFCIFFDESGTSVNDPMVVVAGVLVDGNTQWKPIQQALASLRDLYVSREQLPHFKGFHATDMFHGSGKVFGRNVRSLEQSRKILTEVIELPSKFRLPVAFGYTRKADSPENLKTPRERRDSSARHHALAACYCCLMADNYLKNHRPNDLAWAVAEDNTEHKKVVSGIHSLLHEGGEIEGFSINGLQGERPMAYGLHFNPGDTPLTKIVSGYHYVSKNSEPLLQLADVCAFVVRRWLQHSEKGEELFALLTSGDTCRGCGFANPAVGNGMIGIP